MYLLNGVPFSIFVLMPLLYLPQSVAIINRNLPGDEFLALEKLCTVLFCTGKLKITKKRTAACAKITQATCARAPQNSITRAADCMRLA